ncbi:DUF1692-domain-containing protein [Jaminaea rosea]|uniref:DUF1692-domain-containing protein n=1 Tax=Jaminaea rosea TaxID=1569628 RepID=A0A316UTB4_9BASI|nr:DUF1692-domain-containing protein [Jaminaea rosea]PWN27591.1 DUF1692-domain-containing protein [Jaminaea rosea]
MGRNGPLGSLRSFDAFSKPLEDVRIRSSSGALLTFASFALISILTLSSYMDYRKVHLTHSLEVDRSRGERLAVDLDISFPRVPCFLLSLDVMDISGEHFDDVRHDMERIRLSHSGAPIVDPPSKGLRGEADKIAATKGKDYCGSCYGAKQGCCNTCDEVQEAYQAVGWSFSEPETIEQCVQEHWTDKLKEQSKEGCRVKGRVFVNKITSNMHFSPGRSFSRNSVHMHDVVSYLKGSGEEHHSFEHTIHKFSFGAENEFDTHPSSGSGSSSGNAVSPAHLGASAKKRLDIVDPLSGTSARTHQSEYMFQYFVKVVATEYHTLAKERIDTFQYAATGYERDLSPQAMFGGGGHGGGQQHAGQKGKDVAGTHHPNQVQHGFAGIPGVFFNYEISPLRTVHREYRMPFGRLLSSLCSIVGGVLTVAGLVDAAVWNWRVRRSAQVGSTDGAGGGVGYAGVGGGMGQYGSGMASRGGKFI